MDEPGTKIIGEETTTRTPGGVEIEQTIIRWNATARISVDYRVGNVDIYADPHQLISFDEPLTDSQLIELLAARAAPPRGRGRVWPPPTRTQGDNPMSEPSAGSRPRLPVVHVREARPYLEAPFPAHTIGVFARREPREPGQARAVFFVPVRQVEARLTSVFGLGNWSPGTPSVLDARSLSCSLTVLGVTKHAVGQGADRLAQAANGTKHCALLIGVGSYLAAIDPLPFPIGDQPGRHVMVAANGHLILPRALEDRAREHYAAQINGLQDRYGPPLEHTPTPWNRTAVPLGRARGLAALLVNVLDRAERQSEPRPLLRGAVEALINISPGGLQARTAARRSATTNPASGIDDEGELIEVDFRALGPQERRWAA